MKPNSRHEQGDNSSETERKFELYERTRAAAGK